MEALAALLAEQQELIGQLQGRIGQLEMEKDDLAAIAEKADARAEELQEQFDALRPTEKTYLDLRRYIREDKATIARYEASEKEFDEAVKNCQNFKDWNDEKQVTLDLIRDCMADFCQDLGLGSHPDQVPFKPIQTIIEELEKYKNVEEEPNED